MGRGYPDFFGYPTHPEYGEQTLETQAGLIVAPTTTGDLVDIDFKGRITGGWLHLTRSAFAAQQHILVYIDNVLVDRVPNYFSFSTQYGFFAHPILGEKLADHERLFYELTFKPDTVVNFNLLIRVWNDEAAGNVTAACWINYSGYEAP